MLLIFIQVFNVLLPGAVSVPTVYDQRQSGNSNVRIDVKDAVLIAIADEFGDYDYTYDYSDLTIKPELPPTSSKPVTSSIAATTASPVLDPKLNTTTTMSTTVAASTRNPLNSSVIIDNSTLTFVPKPVNETEPEKLSIPHSPLNAQDYQIPVIVVHEQKENTKLLPVKIMEKLVAKNEPEVLPQLRNCSPGFFLDNQNRCKRIRKPLKAQASSQLKTS